MEGVQSRQERVFVPVEPNLRSLADVDSSVRELRVVGEIAQAFLTSQSPEEVYSLALERLTAVAGASFACVFLREAETDLLRVAAEYNWPAQHADHLETMRVRVGNGPTGRAVLENALVEISDVFASDELEDWWEAARELGFRASIALPLCFESQPVGALTFYFAEQESFLEADRALLRLVADQLAATAEKAHLIDDLRSANEQLREQNVELEARYREAEEARQIKTEFLANVSHELRTPLTAILGYAYLLKEGVHGDLQEEQEGAIRRIEDAGGHLVTLIDGLLDLTNLRLGKIEAEPELCDAVALARSAVASNPALASEVEVETVSAAAKVPVHTDPVLVQRILQSLLSNAVKFAKDGSVFVRVKEVEPEDSSLRHYRRGPDVLWEVADTGIGIDLKDQELIFEDFRQADGSATRRFGGAGLGLAVARGLARRLGGDITVESKLGEGAKFTFRLPSSVVRAGA